jgi:hypothetical protein
MDKLNLCDLYFDKKENVIKNSKEDIIATLESYGWKLDSKQIERTYSKEYQKGIISVFLKHNKDNPIELLIKINKKFSQIKLQKIDDDELIKNAAITLDLNQEEIQKIQNKLDLFLKNFKLNIKKINNPHVSTAYLQGYNSFAELADTIKTISNYSYEFEVIGVEILSGATTDKDYLVLKLNAPISFYKALQLIENKSETKTFIGGFKIHLSLFEIEKGLSQEQKDYIKEKILNDHLLFHNKIFINPHAISVFNESKLLELRQKLKNINYK